MGEITVISLCFQSCSTLVFSSILNQFKGYVWNSNFTDFAQSVSFSVINMEFNSLGSVSTNSDPSE